MIVIFYSNAKIIVPQTIVANRVPLFFLWVIAVLLSMQIISYYYDAYTQFRDAVAASIGEKRRHIGSYDNFVFTLVLLVLAISTGWALLMHWQGAAQRERALERDKVMTELALLKMQINPHFFFNSLNSVYSLTYIEIEDSRRALLTLSRMMRYLLYNVQEEMTTLVKDIDFLKDYVSIMQLRATKKVKINFEVPELLIDYPIAPMLLLPFVENAFKHGVDAKESGIISIQLQQSVSRITLTVVNEVFDGHKDGVLEEGGLGQANTARRLELLYPGRHLLQTGVNAEGKYEVLLIIELI